MDGWPALQVGGEAGPIPLPLVHPRIVKRNVRDYVDRALLPLLEDSPEARAQLAEFVTMGDPRAALPRFRGSRWGWLPSGRRIDALPRAVELAVRSDLDSDNSLDRLPSDRLPPLDQDPSPDRSRMFPPDRSDARKQRARGRLVLHRLGAWPWALTDDGELPYGWDGLSAWKRFEQPGDEFIEALRKWAVALISQDVRDLKRSRELLGV